MVNFTLFVDLLRQEEIETFYKVCQMHREYYKGYPKSYHPYSYFREGEFIGQCPPEMSEVYLSFPPFHMKYKEPTVLASEKGRTTTFPPLPDRSLAARYNKAACKAFIK